MDRRLRLDGAQRRIGCGRHPDQGSQKRGSVFGKAAKTYLAVLRQRGLNVVEFIGEIPFLTRGHSLQEPWKVEDEEK